MNLYDKEERIIEFIQSTTRKDILFFPNSFKSKMIFKTIWKKNKWSAWTNSSGKNELPPDYFNKKRELMMDVMRIDDHAFVDSKGNVINPHNQRESIIAKELILHNPSFKEAFDKGRVFINPDTGLRGYEDHNYNFYVNNFNRVVTKHINKIPLYKKNHKDFKTIFLIFDESSPYFENLDPNFEKFTAPNQCKFGLPHFWWTDYNFLMYVEASNIDYLIWVTPYKHFDSLEKIELPKIIVCDLSKLPFKCLKTYDEKVIESLEI